MAVLHIGKLAPYGMAAITANMSIRGLPRPIVIAQYATDSGVYMKIQQEQLTLYRPQLFSMFTCSSWILKFPLALR
jgi:hypothetical protein